MKNRQIRIHPKIVIEKSSISKLDLLPSQIRNNPRANLFPKQVKKASNSVKSGLWQTAYDRIKTYEMNQFLPCKSTFRVKDINDVNIIKEKNHPQSHIAHENWTSRACGKNKSYHITYIATELDEFYTEVTANAISDKYGQYKTNIIEKIFN